MLLPLVTAPACAGSVASASCCPTPRSASRRAERSPPTSVPVRRGGPDCSPSWTRCV